MKLALCAFVVFFVCFGSLTMAVPVKVLTDFNFDMETSLGLWFLEFYTPWCGHCKRLAPVWEELAQTVTAKDMSIGKVDCTKEVKTCEKLKIRGYPSLKFIKYGTQSDYTGSRELAALVEFTKEGYKALPGERNNRPKTVVVGGDIAEEKKRSQQEARERAARLAQQARGPAGDSQVVILTDETFYSQIETGAWFVKFYAPWCGHCKTLAPIWDSLSTKTDGAFKVAKIDCTINREICGIFGVRSYPTLKFIKDGKLYQFNGERSEQGFLAFATSGYPFAVKLDLPTPPHEHTGVLQKQEPAATKSTDFEEVESKATITSDYKEASPSSASNPAQPGRGVVVLTAKNFDEKVASGDWIVEFYAPWCGHCKGLAPIWENLGRKASQNVAKVDCTVEKSLATRFGIRGYPTIKYISGGKVYDYKKGARTLDGFLQFMNGGYKTSPSAPLIKAPTHDEL